MKPFLALVAVVLACSGCFRSTTTITVRADGSGLIDTEMGANPQALAMLKGLAGGSGQGGAPAPTEFFNREQAETLGAQMGVKLVSGEPVKTAELDGYRARYSFADITKLNVKMNQDPTGGSLGSTSRDRSAPPFAFGFERRGASSILTITMPTDKGLAGGNPLGQLPGAQGSLNDPQQAEQALAMMKMMMRGLFVDVSLAVDGRVVKTNAPHVSGSKVTLVQMDFDKMLADAAALQKLQKLQHATDARALQDIPGLKIITDPQVSIEFAR